AHPHAAPHLLLSPDEDAHRERPYLCRPAAALQGHAQEECPLRADAGRDESGTDGSWPQGHKTDSAARLGKRGGSVSRLGRGPIGATLPSARRARTATGDLGTPWPESYRVSRPR